MQSIGVLMGLIIEILWMCSLGIVGNGAFTDSSKKVGGYGINEALVRLV